MTKRPAASNPSASGSPNGSSTGATSSNAVLWAEGLLCGGLVTLLPTIALLLGVLLGPAIVALVLDHQRGKPVARSVVLCTLAASIGPVRTLWAAGYDLAASLALATDLNVVGTAWSAAAGGWLLAELTPFAMRAGLEALSLSRAAHLRASRNRLVEEWGLGGAPADGPPVRVDPTPRR